MSLDRHLQVIRAQVRTMARAAQELFDLALACVREADEARVAEVLRRDLELNELESRLDALCLEVLLLQEAYAVDFRFLVSAGRIVRDLEAVGDEAKQIAGWARRMARPADAALLCLGETARGMLAGAVTAFVEDDRGAAEAVRVAEHAADDLERRIVQGDVDVASAFVAHGMERVADLAESIADSVLFTVRGEDVRHPA